MNRFYEKMEHADLTDCLVWTGAKSPTGYGRFLYEGANRLAHRVAWLLRNGDIPQGKRVLHKCDVRCCVNPDHLYIGTQKENYADMESRGRTSKEFAEHRDSNAWRAY